MSDADVEMINDFCREAEELLVPLERNIEIVKNYVFDLPYEAQEYFKFLRELNINEYLENLRGVNRAVHTIKGVSSFMDLPKTNKYCHTAEDLTLGITKGKFILNLKAFEVIERIPVILNRLLEKIKKDLSDENVDIEGDLQEIRDCVAGLEDEMKGCTFNLEELQGKDFGKVRDSKSEFQVSIELSRYDSILQEFQAFFQDTVRNLYAKGVDLETIHTVRTGLTEHLNHLIMASQSKIVLTRYARIVSDMGRSMKKQISLNIERNEAWARPDIWDKCHNALVHLVRNSLDHGIELPDEREGMGKEREGRITMNIHEDFKNIYISVEDDGRGIDGDKIAKAAIEKQAVSEIEVSKMTDEEKIKIIFRPDFSTKQDVTDVSGRGVGMDAVSKAIEENLKGYVHVTSEKNKGTRFLLEIPKSETLTECVLFGSDRHTYAIPVVSGIEYLECNPKYLKKVFAETPMYTEGSLELPLLNVFKALHPAEYDALSMEYLPIIKVDSGSASFGLVAPHIKGQERIKIDRSSVHKKVSKDTGLIFGYGLTDPITVVLDVDKLMSMV